MGPSSFAISGGLFAAVIIRFKAVRIRKEILDKDPADLKPGKIWDVIITYFVPLVYVLLLSWWLINDGMNGELYNPFGSSSLATALVQLGIIITVLLAINKWVIRKTVTDD